MGLLIADDDDRTTMVLRDSLPAFGFDVVGDASNGAEAGDKVAELKPEVVLLDLRMPGVDGMEATVLIKAQEPRTQVVILTAYLSRIPMGRGVRGHDPVGEERPARRAGRHTPGGGRRLPGLERG